jgi:hypothetical protein
MQHLSEDVCHYGIGCQNDPGFSCSPSAAASNLVSSGVVIVDQEAVNEPVEPIFGQMISSVLCQQLGKREQIPLGSECD